MLSVLVIDDEPLSRTFIREMLELDGFEVTEAGNGREALERFRTSPADVVICDIVMPVMEGIETMRELRAISPQSRIIAISGGGRIRAEEFLKFASKLGADYVLAKPIDYQKLRPLVASFVPPHDIAFMNRPH